jgi:hypothetical protein
MMIASAAVSITAQNFASRSRKATSACFRWVMPEAPTTGPAASMIGDRELDIDPSSIAGQAHRLKRRHALTTSQPLVNAHRSSSRRSSGTMISIDQPIVSAVV